MKRLIWAAFLAAGFPLAATAPAIGAEIVLYESATLGPAGVTWSDAFGQVVPASNVNSAAFTGVRFYLEHPVVSSHIGGHFVGPSAVENDSLFAALVKLTAADDFPDSGDLSTPDVVGVTTLILPEPSSDAFGDLVVQVNPGWYALVFGSGQFSSMGSGGLLRNNTDIGAPDFIGFGMGFGWGTRSSGARFVLKGIIVPEPISLGLVAIEVSAVLFARSQLRCG